MGRSDEVRALRMRKSAKMLHECAHVLMRYAHAHASRDDAVRHMLCASHDALMMRRGVHRAARRAKMRLLGK